MKLIQNEGSGRYILLALKHRNGGSLLNDKGEKIEWVDAEQMFVLPFEDSKGYVRKLTLAPSCSQDIQDKLLYAHWGAVVEVVLNNDRQVTDVDVILDSMEALYSDEKVELDI